MFDPKLITIRSALNEFYDILSAAYDADGLEGLNGLTLSGPWAVETDEQAETLLLVLDTEITRWGAANEN